MQIIKVYPSYENDGHEEGGLRGRRGERSGQTDGIQELEGGRGVASSAGITSDLRNETTARCKIVESFSADQKMGNLSPQISLRRSIPARGSWRPSGPHAAGNVLALGIPGVRLVRVESRALF